MKRPSRGDRASATTNRYVGCFLAPMRRKRMRTILYKLSFLSTQMFGHLTRLLELFDEPVDVGNLCAGSARYPFAARTVEQIGIAPLSARHRADDRLHFGDLPFGNLEIFWKRSRQTGNHFEQVGHRTQFAHLSHL